MLCVAPLFFHWLSQLSAGGQLLQPSLLYSSTSATRCAGLCALQTALAAVARPLAASVVSVSENAMIRVKSR